MGCGPNASHKIVNFYHGMLIIPGQEKARIKVHLTYLISVLGCVFKYVYDAKLVQLPVQFPSDLIIL